MMKGELFSQQFMPKLLDGTKIRTSRPCKITVNGNTKVKHSDCDDVTYPDVNYHGVCANFYHRFKNDLFYSGASKPKYQVGNILSDLPKKKGWYYVKWEPWDDWELVYVFEGCETWGYSPEDDPETIGLDMSNPEVIRWRYLGDIIYVRETFHENYDGSFAYKAGGIENRGWTPSIHMPKYAARIFLQVTDVKVQHINDITEQDAIDDGFDSRDEFLSFWYNTYPEDKWMWVYYFKRISKKEAYMNA